MELRLNTHTHTHKYTHYCFEFERIQGSLEWCQGKIKLKSLAGVPGSGRDSSNSFPGKPALCPTTVSWTPHHTCMGFRRAAGWPAPLHGHHGSNILRLFSSFCRLMEEHAEENVEGSSMGARAWKWSWGKACADSGGRGGRPRQPEQPPVAWSNSQQAPFCFLGLAQISFLNPIKGHLPTFGKVP